MLEDMRVRELTPNTQNAYIHQVEMFAAHFGRSPDRLGPEDVRAWQVHLVEVKKVWLLSENGELRKRQVSAAVPDGDHV
jgi:hypothetical protein